MSDLILSVLILQSENSSFIVQALDEKKIPYVHLKTKMEFHAYIEDHQNESLIVLTDRQFDNIPSLEIQRMLKSKCPKWGVVFISSENSTATAIKAMKQGALDFLIGSEIQWEKLSEYVEDAFKRLEDNRDAFLLKKKLSDVEKKFYMLEESVFDAIFITENGNVLEVNDRAEELTGYTREEMLKMNVLDHLIDHQGDVYANRSISGWTDVETRGRKKSGEIISVVINSRSAEVDGKIVRISSARDITEKKQLEEKLRHAEKMNAIGQLAGGIAHDFNNQLSPIIGYADMLSHQLEDPQLRKFAQNILYSALRSADLTKKLLSFARKGQIVMEPFDILDIIEQILDSFSQELGSHIKVNKTYSLPCRIVRGDPSQMEQALRNLIMNGIEAMSEGGTLTIDTHCCKLTPDDPLCLSNHLEPGNYMKIRIGDDGWGIPEELKKNIFEPFFTTKEVGQGTGMGLASAYGAIIEHEGYISFISEEGVGTDFFLYIPTQSTMDLSADSTEEEKSEEVRKSHILIVDDEDMLRSMLEDILISDDHNCTSCSSGEEAVQVFQEIHNSIDLVILDMMMPGMNGYETYTRLKEIDPTVKVIVSSGYNLKSEFRKMKDAGVMAFMKKPYKVNELKKQLKKILG